MNKDRDLEQSRIDLIQEINVLHREGYSNVQIANMLGIEEAQIRNLFKETDV